MTLEEIRTNIDEIDNDIKRLFAERMKLSEEVVLLKAQTGNEIYKPDREKQIIEKLSEDTESGICDEYRSFVKHILLLSRKYQYRRMTELKDPYKAVPENIEDADMEKHNRIKISLGSKDKKCDPSKALQIISEYKAEMTDISYTEEEGVLTVEFNANILDKKAVTLLYQLSKENEEFRIIGSYTA